MKARHGPSCRWWPSDGEVLYTIRSRDARVSLPVFADGKYTVRVGRDRPDRVTLADVDAAASEAAAGTRRVVL